MRPKRAPGLSRRLDTRVAIQSPPDPNDVDNLGTDGALDISAANWTHVGYEWIGMTESGSTISQVGGQTQEVATIAVEMRPRYDLTTDMRMEILSGPYTGSFLWIQNYGLDTITCQLSGRVR